MPRGTRTTIEVAESVFQLVRKRILIGDCKAASVREIDLMSSAEKPSRMAVRSALARLEQEGLLHQTGDASPQLVVPYIDQIRMASLLLFRWRLEQTVAQDLITVCELGRLTGAMVEQSLLRIVGEMEPNATVIGDGSGDFSESIKQAKLELAILELSFARKILETASAPLSPIVNLSSLHHQAQIFWAEETSSGNCDFAYSGRMGLYKAIAKGIGSRSRSAVADAYRRLLFEIPEQYGTSTVNIGTTAWEQYQQSLVSIDA